MVGCVISGDEARVAGGDTGPTDGAVGVEVARRDVTGVVAGAVVARTVVEGCVVEGFVVERFVVDGFVVDGFVVDGFVVEGEEGPWWLVAALVSPWLEEALASRRGVPPPAKETAAAIPAARKAVRMRPMRAVRRDLFAPPLVVVDAEGRTGVVLGE
jgi:hypothetical protein